MGVFRDVSGGGVAYHLLEQKKTPENYRFYWPGRGRVAGSVAEPPLPPWGTASG